MQKVMAVTKFGADLELVKVNLPVPKGNEVLIKTTYAGLCHSDLHQIDGYYDLGDKKKMNFKRTFPFCIGHEIEGEVIAVGENAQGKVNIGQSYGIYPWGGCRDCGECRRGQQNLCDKPSSNDLGNGANLYGGYSSHVLVPHYEYCFDKTGIPDGLAATYMCAGLTAFSAMKKVGTPPNGAKDVLVLGLGGVGMQGFQMAKALFGGAPLAADLREDALDVARAQGASTFNPADPGVAKKIKSQSADGTGIFAVVDFVGGEKTFNLSRSIIRRGGIVIQVGLLGGAMSMGLPLFPLRAMQIKGSLVGSLPECREMFELLKAGKVDPIPYEIRSISRDLNKSIQDMRDGKLVGRVVVKHDWTESAI